MSGHTPGTATPFKVAYHGRDIDGPNGEAVATIHAHGEIGRRDAAYIVHTANNFPVLVEQLENLVRKCSQFENLAAADLLAAQDALTLAKGGK